MKLTTLAMLLRVTAEFFWGEAYYGTTEALRQLRLVRLVVILIPLAGIALVITAFTQYNLAKANDGYSYYEGKVLEERVSELRSKLASHSEDIRKLTESHVAATLLAVQMQGQIQRMQELLDAGIKVLGAVVLAILGQLIKSIFDVRLRHTLARVGGRRELET